MALISSIGEVNLDALDKSIADTAVDIFVYDTRKDSDGGKWRKRTKKTSWYNETLNTATRGSRREFPAVAVIVAETGKVTIYDGDDPDLPMWMVFIVSANNMIPNNGSSYVTGNTMMNATLVVSKKPYDLPIINFISDKCFQYADGGGYPMFGNISQRNSGLGQSTSSITSQTIVNRASNDVAMTVLPNAPIDSATGLPIPTIAVATDGGVSVIKDDGTIVDITASNIYKLTTNVLFDGEKLIWGWDGYSNLQRFVHVFNTIPSSDVNFTNGEYKGSADAFYGNYNELSNGDLKIMGDEDSITKITKYDIGLNNNPNLSLQNHGIIRIYPNYSSPSNGIFANISKDYNTGWMHGDIKGAFLSDTDDIDLVGEQYIPNSEFTSDITGWSSDSGITLSHSTDSLSVINSSGNYLNFYANPLSSEYKNGEVGLLVIKVKSITSWPVSGLRFFDNNVNLFNISSTTEEQVFYTTARSSSSLQFRAAPGLNIEIDYVRFFRIDADRSVNNKGLQVFGTITKSPVAGSGATAAELVAYSGWSTSNYLEQPYNSDFNLTSTQDASWIIWFKNTESIETYYHFFDSGYILSSAQPYWLIGLLGTGDGRPTFRLNGVTQQNLNGIGNYLDGSWHQIIVTRTGNGTLISMYIDGKLSSTLSTSPLEITHTSNAKLRIGLRGGTNNRQNTGGYLTQLRFSKSAPSAEQIKKIYEDEKVLFQENAACTLYGSSDVVTALAYDDKTNLLHVGTSSGRSDFKGLRRINNTTTGITTAISASNRLIAEQ